MGTRGFYVYLWRGRYYVYYNHWDSYPSGLGQTLLSMIPSDPEAYKQWLDQKRAEYSELERRFERDFTILNPFKVNYTDSASVENLETLPSFSKPSNDVFIEWLYIINLDRELFSVNSRCHFKLDSIPNNFESLLEDAEKYNSGQKEAAEVHAAITSEVLSHGEPLPEDIENYNHLGAVLIRARLVVESARKPLSFLCRQLFWDLLRTYRNLIWQAIYVSVEEDFLYREVAFLFLCLATCSPDLVRLARKCKPDAHFKPFNMMNTNGSSGQTSEFCSAIFQGYHLSGKNIGSSPAANSYWLQDVLIYLERSLNCKENYQAAISRAVQKGRDEGYAEFNAIICSILHVVLVRVTESGVEHTKRLRFVDPDKSMLNSVLHRRPEDYEVDDDDDESNDDDESDEWTDADIGHTFDAIGTLFESAARRHLRPSSAHSHGIFPNELYRIIVGHLDASTNMSCLNVSRAFRDFALDIYHMSDNVEVFVARSENSLKFFHTTTGIGLLPSFSRLYKDQDDSQSLWFPIFGNADGTGQFVPSIGISLPMMEQHLEASTTTTTTDENMYQMVERIQRLNSNELDQSFCAKQSHHHFSKSAEPSTEAFDYSTFEKLLPSQEVLASSSDVVGLYAITYFLNLSIFGYHEGSISGTFYRRRPTSYIAKAPLNTWMQIGARENRDFMAVPYAMIWAKQPQEDTSIGWENAVNEAQHRVKHEFIGHIYKLWISAADTPNEGILVVPIGTKIKFFRIYCDLDLPSMENFPHLTTNGQRFLDDNDRKRFIYRDRGTTLWEENGIDATRLLDLISIEALECEDIAAWDVLNKEDRPKIERAFHYIAQLANSLGKSRYEHRES